MLCRVGHLGGYQLIHTSFVELPPSPSGQTSLVLHLMRDSVQSHPHKLLEILFEEIQILTQYKETLICIVINEVETLIGA